MSKLLFEGHEYTLAELLDLRSKSPFYRKGDVIDQDNGETVDIQDIDEFRDRYIDELIDLRKKYGTKYSANLTGVTKKIVEQHILKDLQEKFDKKPDSLTTDELKDLIELKLKPSKRNMFKLSFSSFYSRNKQKDYPEELSFNDIGRYDKILKYLTKYNDIRTSNRKDAPHLKNNKLTDILQLSEKRFFQYLNKIQKYGLINYIKKYNCDVVLFINPVYSYMQGDIDYSIYTLFKSDLDEYLTQEEIEYLKRMHESKKLRYTNVILSEDV